MSQNVQIIQHLSHRFVGKENDGQKGYWSLNDEKGLMKCVSVCSTSLSEIKVKENQKTVIKKCKCQLIYKRECR